MILTSASKMAAAGDRQATFEDFFQMSKILKLLHKQRREEKFCDVVLRVCDEQIYAHSNVLAAASPYFATLFSHAPDLPRAFSQKTPQIIEIRIDGSEEDSGYNEAVRKVVDFMYTNSIVISYGIVNQVLEIARIMQMNSILDFCDKFQQGQDGNDDKIKLAAHGATGLSAMEQGTQTDFSKNAINEPVVDGGKSTVDCTNEEGDYDETSPTTDVAKKKKDFHSSVVKNSQSSTTKTGKRKRGRPPKHSYIQDVAVSNLDDKSSVTMTEEEKAAYVEVVVPEEEKGNDCEKNDMETTDPNTSAVQPVRVSLRLKTAGLSRYKEIMAKIKPEIDDHELDILDKIKKEPVAQPKVRCFYQCPQCSVSSPTLQAFRVHRKTHESPCKYVCDQCDFIASRVKEMKKHKREHMHAQKHCSFCGWICTEEGNDEFEKHLARHTGPHPYFCMSCDRKFRTRTQLNLHIPKHSQIKPFVCHICHAGFKWKHALKSHMITHKDTKDHLCDVCGFSTAHKSQLKAHRLIHTGETFKCPVEGCHFQATKQQSLKYHMLTHTHEKPHQCEICGQAFSLIKNMRRHMLLHTNERPYKCEQCSFSTTRYDKLKDHYFKQHNIGVKPAKKLRLSDYHEMTAIEEFVMPADLQGASDGGVVRNSEEEMQTIEVQVEDGGNVTATQFVTHVESSTGETVPIAIATVEGFHLTEVQYQDVPAILVTQSEQVE